MSPSILALDGGGVRGVIPLEYLLLVQEHLQPSTIHNVVDLAIGTSSGQSKSNF
jgi:patatin-like phospholipase/acyl hydrolase